MRSNSQGVELLQNLKFLCHCEKKCILYDMVSTQLFLSLIISLTNHYGQISFLNILPFFICLVTRQKLTNITHQITHNSKNINNFDTLNYLFF